MKFLHVGPAVNIFVVLLFATYLSVATPACSQTATIQTATIEGIVIDAQNSRAIPWANVVVRNAKRASDARSFTADGSGHFLATNVMPGSYTLLSADSRG
jgi:Carboxypeptidase regulatory-like domain